MVRAAMARSASGVRGLDGRRWDFMNEKKILFHFSSSQFAIIKRWTYIKDYHLIIS
jgi:hypothetical protein